MNINRICFMSATLRHTGSGVNAVGGWRRDEAGYLLESAFLKLACMKAHDLQSLFLIYLCGTMRSIGNNKTLLKGNLELLQVLHPLEVVLVIKSLATHINQNIEFGLGVACIFPGQVPCIVALRKNQLITLAASFLRDPFSVEGPTTIHGCG